MSDDTRARTVIPKPEDRGEWLAARHPYVGASDVAALFGEHPYVTAAGLARAKLGGPTRDQDRDSPAMRRGRILEDPVARWCAEDLGLIPFEPPEMYAVEDVICATLDRRVIDKQGNRVPGAIEVKTAAEYVSEPKRSWWWQAQAQLLAVPLEWVVIACLDSSLTLQTWTVLPDVEAHEEMLKRAETFLRYVRAGEVPPDDSLPFTTRSVSGHEMDEGAVRIVHAIRVLRAKVRDLQSDESKLREVLESALGEDTDGYHDGRLLFTYRPTTSKRVDLAALKRAHPDIAEAFTEESTYRRLVLK